MKVRPILESDLTEVLGWFQSRKWPQPPIEGIAPTDGLVAEHDGVLVACAWFYTTGRSIAYIEWTGTNPALPDGQGAEGLIEIVEALKEMGDKISPPVKAWCMFTQNEKLAAQFERMKFKKQSGYQRVLWVRS